MRHAQLLRIEANNLEDLEDAMLNGEVWSVTVIEIRETIREHVMDILEDIDKTSREMIIH